jgi:hypothetical protein
MIPLAYLASLGATLSLEVPTVAIGYRGIVSWRRSLAVALATNLATHGLLWSLWPFLQRDYVASLAVAESIIVLAEAACYRFLLGGTALRALALSALANLLSVAAGFGMSRIRF